MTPVSSTAGPNAATAATGSATKLNADFSMFLKLLTTQMQNQDPLSPMDTAQYTQQLVQFSQVEQSIQQTETLKSILTGLGSQNLAQATSLIGHQITVDSAQAGLGDRPATWTYSADRTVATLTATIADAQGRVVEKRSLDPAAAGSFSWEGKLSAGGTAPRGVYTLSLSGIDAAGSAVPITISSVGQVDEVGSNNGAVTLSINGAPFTIDKIKRIAAN